MDGLKDSAIEAILEQLIKEGPNGVAPAFASLFELAMQICSAMVAGLCEALRMKRAFRPKWAAKRSACARSSGP